MVFIILAYLFSILIHSTYTLFQKHLEPNIEPHIFTATSL
nr:MAG TPA: Photosystem II reaction centre N protein (psbN) [Caudoviricetes sp.]